MNALRRYLVLFISVVIALAGAGGYMTLILPDKLAPHVKGTDSRINLVGMEASVLFFGLIYATGRIVSRLLGDRALSHEIGWRGGWHMKILLAALAISAGMRFTELHGKSWGRLNDWIAVALLGALMIVLFYFQRGPTPTPAPLPEGPRDLDNYTQIRANLRSMYERAPRQLDNYLHNRTLPLKDYYGSEAQFRLCASSPSAKAWSILAAGVAAAGLIAFPFWRPAVALVFVGLAIALAGVWIRRRHRERVFEEVDDLARRGEMALATIVIANNLLLAPGDVPAPGFVVFSLDPAHRFDEPYLADVRDQILRLRGNSDVPAPELREIADWIRDDLAFGPVRVPESIAGNTSTWLCDVIVNPLLLPGRSVNGPPFAVLADLGSKRLLQATLIHL